MSEFKPVDIKKYLQTPIKAVDKTDKTGFVSFVKQNLPVIEPEKKDDASLTLEAQIEKSTRVDAEPTEPDNDLRRRKSSPDLAVSFLEAVEALLVTIKDERPPSFLTPQLKRDLKAAEEALSAYRAELLPDAPDSRAVGESLANRYRKANRHRELN
jgi:hypothetical protein